MCTFVCALGVCVLMRCVCVRMRVFAYACMCGVCVRACVRACVCVVCAYVCVRVRVFVCARMCVCASVLLIMFISVCSVVRSCRSMWHCRESVQDKFAGESNISCLKFDDALGLFDSCRVC